jgi:hypothetical protein
MAEDLFDRPYVRLEFRAGDGIVNPPQFARRFINDASQFSRQ